MELMKAKKILEEYAKTQPHSEKSINKIKSGLEALENAFDEDTPKHHKKTFNMVMEAYRELVRDYELSKAARTEGDPIRDLAGFLSTQCRVWLDLSGGPSIDEQFANSEEENLKGE